MDTKQIRKEAKKLGKGNDFQSLKTHIAKTGWRIYFYGTENNKTGNELLDSFGLTEYSKTVSSFNYETDKIKIIFIQAPVSMVYAAHLLAHEIGHIQLGHTKHRNDFVEQNLSEEMEADYFADCVTKQANKYKKVSIFLALVIFCGLVFVIHYNLSPEPIRLIQNVSTMQTITEGYNEQVVITSSGTKYHKTNCRYIENKTNAFILTRGEAESAGYEACKHCFSSDN